MKFSCIFPPQNGPKYINVFLCKPNDVAKIEVGTSIFSSERFFARARAKDTMVLHVYVFVTPTRARRSWASLTPAKPAVFASRQNVLIDWSRHDELFLRGSIFICTSLHQ